MKLKIEGSFGDKEELNLMKEKTGKLLLEFGFKNIQASEDIITGEFHFRAETS